MQKRRTGKIISMLLVLCLIIGVMPLPAVADSPLLLDSGTEIPTGVILAAFDTLPEETLWQGYDFGEITSEDEINLPDTLNGTDDENNPVTLSGVIWQSTPNFDGTLSQMYEFTPMLPDGYIAAEGVTAPVISVFIRPEGGVEITPRAVGDFTAVTIAGIDALSTTSDTGWSWDIATNTLTITGDITGDIKFEGTGDVNITVSGAHNVNGRIICDAGLLTLSGGGTLIVESADSYPSVAIGAYRGLTVDDITVNATTTDTFGRCVYIDSGDFTMLSGTLTANGVQAGLHATGDIYISGTASVMAAVTTGRFAIAADGNIMIDGNAVVTGNGNSQTGIYAGNGITISGGTVTAKGEGASVGGISWGAIGCLTGGVTVNGGILTVGGAGASPANGNVGGGLTVTDAADVTVNGSVTGNLTVSGGAVTVTGTVSGSTNVTGGTVSVDGAVIPPSGGTGTATGIVDIGGEINIPLNSNAGSLAVKGWEWNAATATLTLSAGYTGECIHISCQPADDITINYTGDITVSGTSSYGIYCKGNLSLGGGGGTLTITGSGGGTSYGLGAGGDLTITGGSISATGDDYGISVDKSMAVSGGSVSAEGGDYGIIHANGLTVSDDASVTATATGTNGSGVGTNDGNVIVTGGSLTATGTEYAVDTKKGGIYGKGLLIINGGAVALNHADPVNRMSGGLIHTGGTLNGYAAGSYPGGIVTISGNLSGNNYAGNGKGTDGGFDTGNATSYAHASGNRLTATSGTFGGFISFFGGYSVRENENVTGNTVAVNGGNFSGDISWVYGGQNNSLNASASDNAVIISAFSGSIRQVIGGASLGGSTGNSVTIRGGSGTIEQVGGGNSLDSNATGNTVTISGGRVTDTVYGGYAMNNATGNTVTITGSPDLSAAKLLGGHSPLGVSDTFTGNTLNLHSAITVAEAANFENYNFHLPSSISNGSTMLTTAAPTDLTGVHVNLAFESTAPTLAVGGALTLISNVTGTYSDTVSVSGYTFALSVSGGKLIATVTAVPSGGSDDNSSGGGSDDSSSGGGGTSGSGFNSSTAFTPANVSQSQAADAAKNAAQSAKANGAANATVNIKNVAVITLDALQAMAKSAGMPVRFQADTMSNDGKVVDVRITLDPAKSTKELNLNASATSARAKAVKALFEKWFKNRVQVIVLEQSGSFGQPVEIAARIDLTGMDTKNLRFYSYDKATNTYKRIEKPAYWIDANGYLHFTTELAGEIIISDGALERK